LKRRDFLIIYLDHEQLKGQGQLLNGSWELYVFSFSWILDNIAWSYRV